MPASRALSPPLVAEGPGVTAGRIASAPSEPVATDRAGEFGVPFFLRSGVVIGIAVSIWTFIPNVVARPRYVWPLEGAVVVLLLASVAVQRRTLRWSIPSGLVLIYTALTVTSVNHYGSFSDLTLGLAVATMAVTATLLGTNMGPRDLDLLVNIVLLLSAVQLLLAAAEQFTGLSAPWGYLGHAGATFETNPVIGSLSGRATGSTGHPIPLGLLMAVATTLALFAKPRWRWLVRVPIAVVFAAGLALSGARSAVLALPVALLLSVMIPLRWRFAGALRLAMVVGAATALVFGNLQDARIISSLQGTGSLTHRLGAIDAAIRLTTRPLTQTLFGSGWNSLPELFAANYLQLDGFLAVDNQVVTAMALGGLVGAIALVAAALYGLARARPAVRPAVAVIFLMFFSFDLLLWFAPATLFFALLALGSAVPELYGADGDGEPNPSPG